jgi:phosphoribosylformylglycinamidine synthase
MVTPWSTNASEVARNVGIPHITRIECFIEAGPDYEIDSMLQERYQVITRDLLRIDRDPEPTVAITDIAEYNQRMGLALSEDEVRYLNSAQVELNRPFTDAEIFGFAQINSEHCRHKIFNGKFIVNDKEMPDTLFGLIKKTSKNAPENLVSAYNDNVAFLRGPRIAQFAPLDPTKPSLFELKDVDTAISIKAETHNYPTQVEPFNGAATGSGGEIRDRLAGGTGSIPLVGIYDGISPNTWSFGE